MTDTMNKLLAAAEQFSGATSDLIDAASDLIDAARDGELKAFGNVAAGDTLTCAADGLRLLIEATDDTDDPDASVNQMHGALIRFLEERA